VDHLSLVPIQKLISTDELSREEIEAKNIINNIFEHDEDRGAMSTLVTGMPGSCKTALDCNFIEYAMNHYREDKIFFRNALNAPIQAFKLPQWHLFIEQDSGIQFFDRKTGKNHTPILQEKGRITTFKTMDELYETAEPRVCNCVFFRDQHIKDVEQDEGVIGWFRFIRYLIHKKDWQHVLLDEVHELIKSGASGRIWHEIKQHSHDVSNARKGNVVYHANCHQVNEIDHRVTANIMILIQMYGSHGYKHSPVNKNALNGIPRPNEKTGAVAWISMAGRFGRFTLKKVYKLPWNMSIEARIVGELEHTKVCPHCQRIYIYNRSDQIYCSPNCAKRACEQRKKEQEYDNDIGSDIGITVPFSHPRTTI